MTLAGKNYTVIPWEDFQGEIQKKTLKPKIGENPIYDWWSASESKRLNKGEEAPGGEEVMACLPTVDFA